MLIGIFYSQIVESSSLVSVLFREAISHPYISFFHLQVNGFSVTSFRTFLKTPYLYYTGGRGGIKMASAKTISLIARNDLFLGHVVQLKSTITDQISGKLVSNGISDVAIASINSEKTLTKKMIMIIIIITEKPFTSK